MFYNKIPDGKLLVIWDSVAATPSEAELKADEDKADMGTAAKAISRGLKKYNSYCTKNGLTFVIINQIRDAVGVMYGSKVTTPGGKAIKFYSSLRIEVKPKEVIKDGNTPIGLKVKAKTVKNKTYIPYLESDIFIDFENGLTFDNPQALLDALIEIEELIPVRNKNGNLSGKYFLKSGDEEDAKTLKVWKELIEENEEVKEALLTISRGEGELI
jgi:recombination protein RecA